MNGVTFAVSEAREVGRMSSVSSQLISSLFSRVGFTLLRSEGYLDAISLSVLFNLQSHAGGLIATLRHFSSFSGSWSVPLAHITVLVHWTKYFSLSMLDLNRSWRHQMTMEMYCCVCFFFAMHDFGYWRMGNVYFNVLQYLTSPCIDILRINIFFCVIWF